MHKSKFVAAALAGAAVMVLSGCDNANPNGNNRVFVENPPPTLPMSINEMMVGMVDNSSDYLFAVGNGDLPKDDADWAEVENRAYETVIAAKAMQLVGTGPNDMEWASQPEWQQLADELSAIGMEAHKLAAAKEVDGWTELGDRLVQNCMACHEKYKPDIPTGGIFHGSSERESKGESIFD
jgi:hypothetical protein